MSKATYKDITDAVKENDLDAVKEFLNDEEFSLRYDPENDLLIASGNGATETIAFLLMYNGTNYAEYKYEDLESTVYTTLLAEALLNGHKETARMLIEKGSYVNESYYILHSSMYENFTGYDSASSGIVWWLADAELQNFMLNYDLNVDAAYDDGKTALNLAIKNGNSERVIHLLAMSADPNQNGMIEEEYWYDKSPLAYAIDMYFYKNKKASYLGIIKALLAHGAHLNVTFDGESTFDIYGKTTIADIILNNADESLDKIFGLQNIRKHLMQIGNPIIEDKADLTENMTPETMMNVWLAQRKIRTFYAFSYLYEKYGQWLRPELVEINIVHRSNTCFLVLISNAPSTSSNDEAQKLIQEIDLSFIASFDEASDSIFDDAKKFIEELDPFSIIMTLPLFTYAACIFINDLYCRKN